MKGEKTLRILEAVASGTTSAAEIFAIIATAPYGMSYQGFEYRLHKLRREKERSKTRRKAREEFEREKRRFVLLLSKMKREGLVRGTMLQGNGGFLITTKGHKTAEKIKQRLHDPRRLPNVSYKTHPSTTLKIVIFDIPESDRHKRAWLRQALACLGFKMLQKSVWIGKVALSEEFITTITKLRLAPHIEIFAVTKTGSLRPML